MPTPFTHLAAAQRLLADPLVPAQARALLAGHRGAFLLGHIAADARVSSGIRREDTHFYTYDGPLRPAQWRVMTARYSALARPPDQPAAAFTAAYVAHLTMDTVWSMEMVRPVFADREWAPERQRFLMLNALLIWMDRRDYALLEDWLRPTLAGARPARWAPFIPDRELTAWRDFIAGQLPPDGEPATLDVIGERVGMPPAALAALVGSPERMQADLWAHVTPGEVARAETRMYDAAREQMIAFLAEAGLPADGGGA